MPVAIVVFAGLLAALCIMGVDVFNKALQGMLNSIPLIGGALARTVQFDAAVVGWLWDHLPPWTSAVQTPHVQHATEQGLNVVAHQATAGALQKVHQVTVPQAQAQTLGTVHAIYDPFVAGVNGFISGVNGYMAWATPRIDQVVQQSTVVLPNQIAQSQGTLQREIDTNAAILSKSITGTAAQLERDIAAAGAAAQAGAVRQLAPTIGGIQTEVGSIAGQIAGSITPALAQQLGMIGALQLTLSQVVECTLGICESGSGPNLGNLGNALKEIDSLISMGLLWGLAAESVMDPKGAADTIDTIVGPLGSAGVSLVRDAVEAVAGPI